MEIKTKRLVLKPLGVKYLEAVHEYASDIENTKYMMHLPNSTVEETKTFLQNVENEWASDNQSSYEFAILMKNKVIGAVNIYIDKDSAGELGWIINKKYWKQGFAYEASKALMDFAVQELDIKHFFAHCDSENVASYKVMEKLGMSRTGEWGGRKNKSSDEERIEYQYEKKLFRELSRKKQQLSMAECIQVLKNETRGVLSVLGDHDYPYGMPMNHWYNEEDGKIYFHCGKVGHRLDSLKKHDKVSFCVYDEGYRSEGEWALNVKSVIVFGRIEVVDERERIVDITTKLSYKFTQDEEYIKKEIENFAPATLLLQLTPEHMSGKLVNEA